MSNEDYSILLQFTGQRITEFTALCYAVCNEKLTAPSTITFYLSFENKHIQI
jgi:hypothetical protein